MINKKGQRQILFAHSGGPQSKRGEGSFDLVHSLRQQLSDDYNIHYPIIDDPEAPTYNMWKKLFDTAFERLVGPIILVGHSLGGSMLLKYLSEEKPEINISGIFLISIPHWKNDGWDIEDFILHKNFDHELKEIKAIFLYHSNEDTIVPFKHLNFYKSAFPNATIRVLNGTDHVFSNGLPVLSDDIKTI